MNLTLPHYKSVTGGWTGAALNVVTVLGVLFLLLPIVVVLVISFSADPYLRFPPSGFSLRWYRNFFFEDPTWLAAAGRSFVVATATAVLSLALGTAAAMPLARHRFPGKGGIEALLLAPLIVSPMITAIALYGLFSSVKLVGTTAALVLSHAILALPYAVMNVSVSARALDERLELAARGLGAGPATVFRRVTLPLLLPGILAGALFAFLASFDEVVVALFLSGLEPTLQKRMWDDIRLEISPTVAAASTLLVAISVLCFVGGALAASAADRRARAPARAAAP